jgi:hypothetical protein
VLRQRHHPPTRREARPGRADGIDEKRGQASIPDEVPVLAIRGNVEDTGNADLAARVLVPIENTIPEPARYTLYHQGKGQMLDHMLITRNPLAAYRGSEIHNEILHDEYLAFATDRQYPESDHAPVVATFEL